MKRCEVGQLKRSNLHLDVTKLKAQVAPAVEVAKEDCERLYEVRVYRHFETQTSSASLGSGRASRQRNIGDRHETEEHVYTFLIRFTRRT